MQTSTSSIAAAAALFAVSAVAISVPAQAAEKAGDTVHCYGINSCKGQSDCKTANNACKGQNTCKGQGFKEVSVAKCTSAGGSTTAPAK